MSFERKRRRRYRKQIDHIVHLLKKLFVSIYIDEQGKVQARDGIRRRERKKKEIGSYDWWN